MTDVAKARQNEKATADSNCDRRIGFWGPKLLCQDLSPWSRTLPENLTSLELVKEFPAFYGTRRFITAFTSARQLSLPSATAIHFLEIGFNSIHLYLGFTSGLFPSRVSLPVSSPFSTGVVPKDQSESATL